MNSTDISQVAAILKSVSTEVFNGQGKLCLSINYLHKLNCALEENINSEDSSNTSFQILPTATKTNLIRDVQFLFDLVQRTISLKIVPDVKIDCPPTINIDKFTNLQILEIQKVDIKNVLGIQKIRSNLQQITCFHSLDYLHELLEKCGGDDSQLYNWSELKKANFSHNKIQELDESLESTPLLHTFDLSHNEITTAESISCLHNLKHLNLSYNKLDRVPNFKGQMCNRLQILILKNNFIEEITGLHSLINLVQLDLSQNCLLDHKSLMSVSHLASLQWLNLQGNPLSFHPHHRKITCNYLNKNTTSLKFVLDNNPLSKSEKTYAGSLYPKLNVSLTSSTNSLEESPSVASERPRRVRNVTIEDENSIVVKEEEKPTIVTPVPVSQHLEIKKQVEQLRQEYGESWLNRHSGLLVQDVLGIEKTPILLSSTPYETALTPYESALGSTSNLHSNDESKDSNLDVTNDSNSNNKSDDNNVKFETANDESTVFDTTISPEGDASDISDGEDVWGEECIYLATIQGESDEVFVVLTQTHISERECTTSKEKARWHISSVVTCEVVEDAANVIKLEFDTIRRDRKQRIYEFDVDEALSFLNSIKEGMNSIKPVEVKLITFQCMKCSEVFAINNNIQPSRLEENSISCPKCESTLVVENV